MLINIQVSFYKNKLNFSINGTYAYLFKNFYFGGEYVEGGLISGTNRLDSASLTFDPNLDKFIVAALIRSFCEKQGKKVKFICNF